MDDRLKDIWKGFEAASGRSLSGVEAARGLPQMPPEQDEERDPLAEARKLAKAAAEMGYVPPSEAALKSFKALQEGDGRKDRSKRRGLFSKREAPTEEVTVFGEGGDSGRAVQRTRQSYTDAVEATGGRPLYRIEASAQRKRRWFGLGGGGSKG